MQCTVCNIFPFLPPSVFRSFNTTVDIKIREWAEKVLSKTSIEVSKISYENQC